MHSIRGALYRRRQFWMFAGSCNSDDRLLMDHLELLGGVDYKDRMEVVYVLYSMKFRHRYTLKCRLPRENPVFRP